MLQRQSWRTLSLRRECHRCVYAIPQSRFCPSLNNAKCNAAANVTITSVYRQYGTFSNIRGSSIPRRDAGLAGQSTGKDIRKNLQRASEPWVDPSSLSDTLDAHRNANREGAARDGIPVQRRVRGQSKIDRARSKRGPWAGVDIIHLPLADAIDRNTTGYSGECPSLLSEWTPFDTLPPGLLYPWLSKLNISRTSSSAQPAIERLNDEIEACGQYFSPSAVERTKAKDVFIQIRNIILDFTNPGAVVDLIGSRATGIEGPISDLDINVKLSADAEPTFRNLDKHMRQRKYIDTVIPHAYIKKAHVPIISGTHTSSGLEFQLQSTITSYESLEVARAYVAEYPKVHILFKVVRHLLLMRGLNSGVLGGVTSYPLLNMIVVSLKLAETHIPNDDVASQLLQFLNFWSEFNLDKHGIAYVSNDEHDKTLDIQHAIDPISAIPRIVTKDLIVASNRSEMLLEDPADRSNNLGKSMYGIKHAQACFIEARAQLEQRMRGWDGHAMSNNKAASDAEPLLGWCLGGNYTAFEEARLQLRRSGDHTEIYVE